MENKTKSYGTEIEGYMLTTTETDAAKMEKPLDKKYLHFLWLAALASFLILSGRILYLNVVKGSYYREIAQGNRIRLITIQAPRGKVMDRHGSLLVNNVPSLDAVIVPADIPQEYDKKRAIAVEISAMLKINDIEIMGIFDKMDKSSLAPVLVKENISQDESLAMMEKINKLPGIALSKSAIREYPDGFIFSHILGYEGKVNKKELDENPEYLMTDYIGKQGIEKSYEPELRGKHGAVKIEVDAEGKMKRELGVIEPEPGNDLLLSVDAKLQKKIFDELTLILEKTETKTSAAVAMNPKNGEILALVSMPSYDNNYFVRGISDEKYGELLDDPQKPLFNRAVSGEYPPGSTIKPLIAVAALAEGLISDSTSIDCQGAINIGSYSFGDWKTHGSTNLRKAIAESCDVFFYSIGGGFGNIKGLGMEKMKKYEDLFGLGAKLGIDIPSEEEGFVPSEQWKIGKFGEKWFTGNSYHAAIGQGYVTATPLQLVNYISAIANGGTLFKPHLVNSIVMDSQESKPVGGEVIRGNFINPDIIQSVREGMMETVISGTAQSLKDLPVQVAGKTGTAQFGAENKTHAWFVSFAPYDNPEIAMVVLVEGGGEGHSSAVPVTKEVYRWYFGERD